MMPFRRYEKYAAHLNNLGYDTTPVNGKRPIIEGWSKRPDGRNRTRPIRIGGVQARCYCLAKAAVEIALND